MLIKHIIKEDLEKTDLKLYSEKSEVVLRRYNEPDNGYFIAESIRVIGRAMDAGYEAVSLLTEERHLDDPLISGLGDITVYVGSEEILSSIAGYKLTGGALCLMKRKSLPCVEEVLKNARYLAVLEGINNPTNVGAIFRDAAALGADALLLTPDCSDPLYRRAARVSMGNVFVLPWCYFGTNQKADIEILKRENF